MKALILATFIVFGLVAGVARADDLYTYKTPAHNYYQNNWMNG